MWRRKSVPALLGAELVPVVNGRAPAHPSAEDDSTWTSAALGGARNKKTVSIQTIVHPFPHASREPCRCRRPPARLPRGHPTGRRRRKGAPPGGMAGPVQGGCDLGHWNIWGTCGIFATAPPLSRPGPRRAPAALFRPSHASGPALRPSLVPAAGGPPLPETAPGQAGTSCAGLTNC